MATISSDKDEPLIADQLRADPRVGEAKKLILAAMEEKKRSITGIRPPVKELKQSYEEALKVFGTQRGGKLFFPYIGSGIGNGALVELADGSIKYDFISGIGVHFFGHSDLELAAAALDAALSDTIMQGNLQQNTDAVALVNLFIRISGFDHCFLCSSGAIANENALKLMLQKKYPAHRILAFERNFIGRTLALSQITDKPAYREGLPLNLPIDYVPYFDPKHPEESIQHAVTVLKKHLHRYPKQHALMCVELVQGEAGAYPGSREFFIEIMTLLKENNIAIFDDEVQTFARTHQLFAYQHFDLKEYIDVVTVGKLSQICATLYTKEFTPRTGLLSQTFTSSTAAIHAAATILNKLRESDLYGENGRIANTHRYFADKLQKLSELMPDKIRGPFGIGAMIAFTAYDGSHEKTLELIHRLFDAGVMSFNAGANPTRLRFLLPVPVMTYQDIDQVVEILQKALT